MMGQVGATCTVMLAGLFFRLSLKKYTVRLRTVAPACILGPGAGILLCSA
jgi:hypothetical protein